MRMEHFENLRPICPRCKSERNEQAPLSLIRHGHPGGCVVMEGLLTCSQPACRAEYPIIEGIPVIVPLPGKYIADNIYHITSRLDLSENLEGVLGDAMGPGSDFNTTRHHWSSYGWDHFADLAPPNALPSGLELKQSSVANLLRVSAELLPNTPAGPSLDIGCAVGRTTFDLAAKTGGLALGIDVNFWLLRIAQRVLHDRRVHFPLKRSGIRFDRVEFNLDFASCESVDFWACDATALPFSPQTFNSVAALNVFDVNPAPRALLAGIRDSLPAGGAALLSSPYDWSPPVPMGQWIEATHRSARTGEPPLRTLLNPGRHPASIDGLKIVGEIEHHPWLVRVHDRRTAGYDAHIVACVRTA